MGHSKYKIYLNMGEGELGVASGHRFNCMNVLRYTIEDRSGVTALSCDLQDFEGSVF